MIWLQHGTFLDDKLIDGKYALIVVIVDISTRKHLAGMIWSNAFYMFFIVCLSLFTKKQT